MTELDKTIVVRVADTETTGFKTPPEGDMVEYAHTDLHVTYGPGNKLKNIVLGETYETFCNPGVPIDLGAMAIHHITNEMVQGKRSANSVREEFCASPVDYWVFHNAAFDLRYMPVSSGRVICSMKAAQVILPNAPAYKNQILRYYLGVDKMMKAERKGDTHRAGFDTYVTALIMSVLLQKNMLSLDDMADLQSSPILLGKIAFGKHKGTAWKDLPKSYLMWLVKNSEDDQIKATCKHFLK